MPCNLTVRSGNHAGAQDPLTEGRTLIGRSLACDIVLSDQQIADEHAVLYVSGLNATLTALEKDVHVVDQGIVPAGHKAKIAFPADLQLGDVVLHFDMPQNRSKLILAVASCVVAAVISLSITANAMNSSDLPLPLPTPKNVVEDHPRPTLPDMTQMAFDALDKRLEQDGLHRTIRLTRNDGALSVSGGLGVDQMAVWKDIERWFDASFSDTALIRDVHPSQTTTSTGKTPTIQSVWFAGKPFISVSGVRYHEGAKLPNGWTLLKIGKDTARFQAFEQTIDVKY
ncbi:FHA domain-containing protein [Pseudaestuariivita rosea]|uniref:FHA domain-containing protein n=1 Tax=Pseudaestuariivita rosea TaxID=2763263 RepID=UPI001ABB7AF3|nr:FHA domain-containing protein [Pseudaestuariivita rosea]